MAAPMALVRLTAVPLAALALVGCGGGEPAAQVRDGNVAMALDDYFLTPQELRASAGRVTFAVTNRGRLAHNFRVHDDDGEVLRVRTLLPEETATRSATLAPGRYRMLCTVSNHAELGLSGTLVVR